MCGIGGFASCGPVEGAQGLLERMGAAMIHRGPDDSGNLLARGGTLSFDGKPLGSATGLNGICDTFGLAHRRLAVIDTSVAGRQPMANEDNTLWLAFNGEIYNFRELRKELVSRGHTFRSNTDSEVVLHGYEEWGPRCLDRFNGMFALAVYDARQGTLFAARDRLGIKPLYWHVDGDRLTFASEVRALLAAPWIHAEADWDGLMGHLLFLWSPEPKTAFRDVTKLPAGHWLMWQHGEIRIEPYWDAKPAAGQIPAHPESAARKLDQILRTSVRRRMVSDVPVGVFLSGGLDSSIIAAMMSEESGQRTTAYTIAFGDEDRAFEAMPDDLFYARQVAQHIGADHHEIHLRPKVADLLPWMISHLEEPVADPAAINTYLICRLAKDAGTTVMLSGMGADEILAGYRKHLSVMLARVYRGALPAWVRSSLIEPVVRELSVGGDKQGYRLVRWMKRFLKSASLPDLECFIGNSAYYGSDDLRDLLQPGLCPEWRDAYPVARHYDYWADVAERDLVTRMTYMDAKLFLPGLNLLYSDKASMAASVETRVPFVDHELVSFALGLPPALKVRGLTQKYLLKRVAENYLPSHIVNRPKAPFGAPLRSWMRRDLMPLVNDLLSADSLKRRGCYNVGAVRKMVEDNRDGREDHAHRLWGLLTIELWHRIFIDREFRVESPPNIDAYVAS
jgi:asparagine synthase (glutamine-hydrolysing)